MHVNVSWTTFVFPQLGSVFCLQLRPTAPSRRPAPPSQPRRQLPTATPRPTCPPPPPFSRLLPAARRPLSNTTVARLLPASSRSPPPPPRRLPPPSTASPPPLTQDPCFHPARLLPPASRSPPTPRHLHPSASLPSCPAPLFPPPRAPSPPAGLHPPLSRGLFLRLLLLPPRCPLASTPPPCRHPSSSSSHRRPSPLPTTQVPLLPLLRCPPRPWPRATICLQDHRGPLEACTIRSLIRACREDSLLSRTVRRYWRCSRVTLDHAGFTFYY